MKVKFTAEIIDDDGNVVGKRTSEEGAYLPWKHLIFPPGRILKGFRPAGKGGTESKEPDRGRCCR